MRSAVVWLCAGVAAFAGYMGSDDPGDSKAEIAEFKSSVAGYTNSIQSSANDPFAGVALNGPPPGSPDFELILNGSPMPAPVVLDANVSAAAARLAAAFKSLNERNQYFAQYDDDGKQDTIHSMHRLVITPSVMKRLGVAAIAAIAAWLAAWLLVVALALVWWFFIDRLRDIAGAVRGEQPLA
jgi:hypothetical protein